MENRNPPASPSRSEERSPFTNLTNTLSAGNANTMSEGLRKQKSKGPQSSYARMSDEKRAEYNQKRRAAYAEKRAAAHTPLSNITNTLQDGAICTAASSVSTYHQTVENNVGRKKRTSQGWYARLSEEKKAEHCNKLRMARLQKKTQHVNVNFEVPHYQPPELSIGTKRMATSSATAYNQSVYRKNQLSPGIDHLQSSQSGVTHMLNTPCSGSAMEDDGDIDWLHNNPTYKRQRKDVQNEFHMSLPEGMHGPTSYLSNLGASSEKKRKRMKEQYAGMTAEDKKNMLRTKRAYKVTVRHSHTGHEPSGSATPSTSSPAIYGQPLGLNNLAGGNNNCVESDYAGIFEPMDPPAEVEAFCSYPTYRYYRRYILGVSPDASRSAT